jgi:hypothetical protein
MVIRTTADKLRHNLQHQLVGVFGRALNDRSGQDRKHIDFLKQRGDQYPWAPGTAQDIAKNGCGKLFVSIEACPAEYDLTAIADGMLRLGDRSHPLCTPNTRPTKLQALGFVRE